MNAEESARIQTPGFLMTALCICLVNSLWSALALLAAALSASSSSRLFSPARSSIGSRPLLSGVSWRKSRMRTIPMMPAMAAPKNPHFQPNAATMDPTKTNDNPSPILCEALKNP